MTVAAAPSVSGTASAEHRNVRTPGTARANSASASADTSAPISGARRAACARLSTEPAPQARSKTGPPASANTPSQ